MNLETIAVKDAGNLQRERLVLRVMKDDDLENYCVFRALEGKMGIELTGEVSDAYWFIDAKVVEGDIIVLYTRPGQTKSKDNTLGRKSYFFYWGKDRPLWNFSLRSRHVPVVLKISAWHTFTPLADEEDTDDI